MRAPAFLLPTLLAAGHLAGPVAAQTLELVPAQPRATVGDVVTLNLRVQLRSGQQLIDILPKTLLNPPPGVRIVSTDTLRPEGNGEYRGRVRIAFYRIGRQPVPTLSLLYRAGADAPPDTLVHAPLAVEIVPLLEPGNPQLRDIKPLEQLGGPVWGPLAILLSLCGAAAFWLWRRGRRMGPAAGPAPATLAHGPFHAALRRLDRLEAQLQASGNGVVPCYAEVARILRDALLEAGAIPHHGLTSAELAGLLPAELAGADGRGRCRMVLHETDLVKFARVRPDRAAALDHLGRARDLLRSWSSGPSDG